MLEPGTKVRVKSKEEINKTLNSDNACNGVIFNHVMYTFCGQTLTLTAYFDNGAYSVNESFYNWRPEWFDVISEDTVESDIWSGTEEDIMLNLAMLHQVESGNVLDLKLLRCSVLDTVGFPDQSHGGFNYSDYPDECWQYSYSKCNYPPDYRWLKLKPEIVEKIIKYTTKQYSSFKLLVDYPDSPSYWFSWHATPERSDYWKEFTFKYNQEITIFDIDLTTSNLTINENERNQIKLQRKKTSIRVGTVPEGCRVHGKRCKTSVRSRHLSYTARIGY